MIVKKIFIRLSIIKIVAGLIFILSSFPIYLSADLLQTTPTGEAAKILSGESQKSPQGGNKNLTSLPDANISSNTNNISSALVNQPQNQISGELNVNSSNTPEISPNDFAHTLAQDIQKATPKGETKIIKVKEYYRVKKGDTVGKIARCYNISQKKLLQLNNLQNDLIRIGQKLFIGTRDKVIEIPHVDEREIKAEVSEFKDNLLREPANNEDESIIIGEKIAQTSLKYLGFPYKYGGESLWGMDCSAFVRRVVGFFGIELPRTSQEQFYFGERTSLDKLIPGDLVFFARGNNRNRRISHVGIYIGDSKFIHASSGAKKVVITNLNKPFYRRQYKGASRITNSLFPYLGISLESIP